jgi:ribokinase
LLKVLVIGAINWDINLFVNSFPRAGEEVVVQRITRVPGGKAGNVAVAAARLLGPNQAAILGGLGKDLIGSDQVEIFEKEGVVVSGIKYSSNVESGQAYIMIDQRGENVIHTYLGANAVLTPEDLDDYSRTDLISTASIIAIMDPPFETSLKLAKKAKDLGKTVAWDPGVKSELGMRRVQALLSKVDYVAANESEMGNLTSKRRIDEAARRLIRAHPHLKVICKLGRRGCIIYHYDWKVKVRALDLHSYKLEVVNTVGCGDAFLGAFASALAEGRAEEEAVKWGNCAAGLKATRAETRGSPDRKTLFRYLT